MFTHGAPPEIDQPRVTLHLGVYPGNRTTSPQRDEQEALKLQLDSLCLEKQVLAVENARL